jgi:NhaP-type Na+/H+ or K+/H+ antiporter
MAAETSEEATLRQLALRHVEHVRKFKLYVFVYIVSMLVLTPVWIVTQYETSPGWPRHLSSRSRYPGDWDPWLIWVALVGAVVVAVAGYRVYADRSDKPAEIDREVARLKTH